MASSASKQSPRVGEAGFVDGEIPGEGEASPAVPAGESRAGAVIDGKYRLDSLVGEGGMGAVWCAHHLQLDLPVAVKLLSSRHGGKELSERFKLEARAAASVVHPAIVRVFDVDTSERGESYIVMELLTGESLWDLLDRGRLSGKTAVQLLLPIAEALALAHAKGIVHRDLKPGNIFVAEEAGRVQPKLLDFGIAKLMSRDSVNGSLTDTGVSVGSPDYMSPEQARGSKDVDARADVWSLSVVLYEAVSGSTPFHGDNYNALMRAVIEDAPTPLTAGPSLDQSLIDLIMWGLAKDRDARPGSMQELGRELASWLLAQGVTEDVCGTQLRAKWITRVAQKSVPVIPPEAWVEPLPDWLEPPAPRQEVGTLPSAGTPVLPTPPNVVQQRFDQTAAAPAIVEAPKPQRSRRFAVALAAGVALAAAWFAFGNPVSRRDASTSAAGLARPRDPVAAGAPVAAAPVASLAVSTSAAPVAAPTIDVGTAVQIASSAPAPSVAFPSTAPQPAPRGHSASLGGAPSRSSVAKPPPAAPNTPSAAKPGRDRHDETRELLQAY